MSAATMENAPETFAASSGAPSYPLAPSATGIFQRNASSTTVASVEQSFFDLEPVSKARTAQQLQGACEANAIAASRSILPMPPLRVLHGCPLSNTRQDFFDDTSDSNGGQVVQCRFPASVVSSSSALSGMPAPCASRGDGTASPQTESEALPSAHQEGGRRGVSSMSANTAAKNESSDRDRVEHVKHSVGGSPQRLAFGHTDSFTRQYEFSGNPYLRAAAAEMKASWEGPHFRSSSGVSDGKLTGVTSGVDASYDWMNRGRLDVEGDEWAGLPHETRKTPKLTQPFAVPAHSVATSASAKLTPFPAHGRVDAARFTASTTASPQALRGIPIFTRAHQRLCPSHSSSAPSLRQSLDDYGQLQLQDEAVHWYHRCSELEHSLAQLQAAYDRQSKVLAAQWRTAEKKAAPTGVLAAPADTAGATGITTPSPTGAEKEAVDRQDRCSASFTPDPVRSKACAASASCLAESPVGRATALTSRSPNSLSPAYMVECVEGEVVECGSEALRSSRFECGDRELAEEALESTIEATIHYTVPKPLGAGSCVLTFADGVATGRATTNIPPTVSAVQRGDGEHAPMPAIAHVRGMATGPTRVSTEVQTDGEPTDSVAFVREDRKVPRATTPVSESPHTIENASDMPGPRSIPSPAAPSAILAKQYTEAVSEIESMQVRLDVAEREAQNLREMCLTQDLRCDDLETQLLAKEEQLLRCAQQPQDEETPLPIRQGGDGGGAYEEAGDGASTTVAEACTTPSVNLKPLVAQLAELLSSVRRVQNEVVVEGPLENDAAEPASLVQHAAQMLQDTVEFPAEQLCIVGGDAEAVPDSVHLSALVAQVRHAVLEVSQHYAAIHAELEVVRADRNELIGEQSEQVRLLQQQLLGKDTEQLQLMRRLHSAEERAVSVASAARAQSVSLGSPEHNAIFPSDKDTSGDAEVLVVQSEEPDTTTNFSSSSTSVALTEEVERLKTQLAEAKASSLAAQEAQRTVLTERLEQAQAELKNTRLNAEDEYDRLSSTIEDLTRALADATEALRVKEVSLRIALREASPATLVGAASISASSPHTAIDAALRTAAVHGSTHPFYTDPSAASPATLRLPQASLPKSPSAGKTSGSDVESRRSDTSRSPPASPPPQERTTDATDYSEGIRGMHWDAAAPALPTLPSHYSGKFVDDGTLRTLPSSLPMPAEGNSGDGAGRGDATLFLGFTTSTSSREKSSRGLTTSTGGVSNTMSSLPRGRSDSSAEQPARNIRASREAALAGTNAESERGTSSRSVEPPSSVPEEFTATMPREISLHRDGAFAPRPESSTAHNGVRQSTSAPVADAELRAGEEMPLPLPLPLRSPLFRSLPSTTQLPSVSPSPLQSRTPPAQRRWDVGWDTKGGAQSSMSPTTNESNRGHAPSTLSASPLSPEERLRNFLTATTGTAAFADSAERIGAVSSGQTGIGPTAAKRHEKWALSAESSEATLATRAGSGMPTSADVAPTGLEIGAGNTPARTPISLLSERTTPSANSTPSSGFGGSPRVSDVAARHTQASLRRHREVWQQQESLLQSLLSTPSP